MFMCAKHMKRSYHTCYICVDVCSKSGYLLPISFPKHEYGHGAGNSLKDTLWTQFLQEPLISRECHISFCLIIWNSAEYDLEIKTND